MQQCVYRTSVWTKICDICDLQVLDTNLGWFWTERYRGCDRPVEWQSEIMCAVIMMWTVEARNFPKSTDMSSMLGEICLVSNTR